MGNVVKSTVAGESLLYVQYAGSACTESWNEYGISHLFEHLKCGAWFRKQEFLTRKAISWNAFTSNTVIAFHLRGLSDAMQELMEDCVLSGKNDLLSYIPTREEFDRERQVVLREHDTVFSTRAQALLRNTTRKHWNFFSPIGLRSVIEAFTYKQIVEFTESQKPNWVRYVTGNEWSPDHEVMKLNSDPYTNYTKIMETRTREPNPDYVQQCDSFSSSETIIGDFYKLPKYSPKLLAFISELWGTGFDSPLLTEIRHKRGLAYSPHIIYDAPIPALFLSVATRPDKVVECRKVLHDMFSAPEKFITRKRFESIREQMLNDLKFTGLNSCNESWVRNEANPFAPDVDTIRGFKYDKVITLLSEWDPQAWTRAELGETLDIA